ncbi:hypothetical protein [Dongia sp.]|uniref:hypothetical protein n=1 Tax=Dongia sp. TaxID=1977262 RepID=UPI0035AED36F
MSREVYRTRCPLHARPESESRHRAAVLGMSHIVTETAATNSDKLCIIGTQDKWAAALRA